MTSPTPPEQRAALERLLGNLAGRMDGAVDFWTVVCLCPEHSMDRRGFLEENVRALGNLLDEVDAQVAAGPDASAARPHLTALRTMRENLLEVFLVLVRFRTSSADEIHQAVARLRELHATWHREVCELGAILGVTGESPGKSSGGKAYLEGILERLSDLFAQALVSEQQAARLSEMPAP